MVVTLDTVKHLAGLAKIGLSEAEAERLAGELSGMAAFADKLAELDVEGVAATTHGTQVVSALREDVMVQSPPRDVILANAPAHDDACFLTPKVLD